VRNNTSPLCPIPHLGYCVQERCNFWDEAQEQCTGECFDSCEPLGSGQMVDPDNPCIIYFTEDLD
jgi:hypothetical protein